MSTNAIGSRTTGGERSGAVAALLKPDAVVADRFRLIREIGRGGMATVWLARHLALDSLCAVKFISEVTAHPTLRARFEREARAAAALRSPHVVQVHDYGVWQNVPFIAMEYLEGEDLEHRLSAAGRLDIAATATILSQVSRALAKAHAEGIVHRDLKPANVFLVKDEDRELVKVLDFGIAKINTPEDSGSTLSGVGQIMGTPEYMSPEQATAAAVDHRADLWALGVMAFRCLTGKTPFATDDVNETLIRIINEHPVPSQVNPALPAAFDDWWRRACAKRPDDRFSTAREMFAEFSSAMGLPASDTGRASGSADARPSRPTEPLVGAATPRAGGIADHVATARTIANATTPRPRVKPSLVVGLLGLALVSAVVVGLASRRAAPPVAVSPAPAPVALEPARLETHAPAVAPAPRPEPVATVELAPPARPRKRAASVKSAPSGTAPARPATSKEHKDDRYEFGF